MVTYYPSRVMDAGVKQRRCLLDPREPPFLRFWTTESVRDNESCRNESVTLLRTIAAGSSGARRNERRTVINVLKSLLTIPGPSPHAGTNRRGRRSRTAATLVALTAVTLAGCSSGGSGGEERGDAKSWIVDTPKAKGAIDQVTWNLLLEPAKLDPSESSNYGESSVLANLCESLLALQPDFSIEDGLASVKASPDNLTLTYSINPKATFWDGSPVTGEDAAYSLTRGWKPKGIPLWQTYFKNVKAIEATGDREVTVTLSQPDRTFEKIMSTAAGAVVQKKYSEANPDFGSPKTGPMCSGPYEFTSWKSGSDIVITRNEDYWRGVEAEAKSVKFSFLQGDATQTKALTGKAIDGMYQAPFTALDQLKKSGSLYLGKSLMTFYVVPTRKNGPLQDPRIRRALFLASDRAGVAKTAFSGAAVPSRSIIAQSAYGAVKPTRSDGTGGSEAELEEARKLVKAAGSPKEPIILVGNPGITESLTQSLQATAEAGKKIGLDVRYKSVTLGEFYGLFGGPEGWKAVNADAFGSQYNFPVNDPMTQFRIWQSPEDYENYGGYVDDEATSLIDEASAQPDQAKRDEGLAKADARLFETMPWIPLVDVANTLYMNKNITGPPASFVYWWYPWAAQLGAAE